MDRTLSQQGRHEPVNPVELSFDVVNFFWIQIKMYEVKYRDERFYCLPLSKRVVEVSRRARVCGAETKSTLCL